MSQKGDVYTGKEAWTTLEEMVRQLEPSRVFVLMDEEVELHCLPYFSQNFNLEQTFEKIIIPEGEKNKNIHTCLQVWEMLSKKGADRHSLMINLGGGMVTDLGGFIASTYMRGISFVNIPTTLLAMVDASVGGKNGVDLGFLKNQIGTINLPEMVIIDSNFLKTLPEAELNSGFAEMIKHAMLQGREEWENLTKLKPLDVASSNSMIFDSIQIKKSIVEEDPYETGKRKLLNFGHTLGHAIESFYLSKEKPLLHGEAIAIGMILAAFISHKTLNFKKEDLEKLIIYLNSIFLKQNFSEKDIADIIDLMIFDKKNRNGKVLFVLMEDFGKFKINCTVSDSLIKEAFRFYIDFKKERK